MTGNHLIGVAEIASFPGLSRFLFVPWLYFSYTHGYHEGQVEVVTAFDASSWHNFQVEAPFNYPCSTGNPQGSGQASLSATNSNNYHLTIPYSRGYCDADGDSEHDEGKGTVDSEHGEGWRMQKLRTI